MKHYCLILLCLLFFTDFNGLAAQELPLVYSLEGKAKYAPDDGKRTKLEVGQELSGAGTLKLKKGSRVGLFMNDAFIYLEGPTTVDLAELAASEGFRESDVNTLFGRQLEAALHPYFAGTGFGFSGGGPDGKAPGVPPKKEKSGNGNKDRKISIQSPLIGKLSGASVTFRWTLRKPDVSVQAFTFRIIDRTGDTVHEQSVNGYSLTLNLPQVGLQPGNNYRWSVTATDKEGVDSGPLNLIYTPLEDQQKITTEMTSDPAYQQASPTARLLQTAAVFEYYEYLQAAREALNQARAATPKDALVQRMYKAFLYRYDLLE
jgi:hypothetical protein